MSDFVEWIFLIAGNSIDALNGYSKVVGAGLRWDAVIYPDCFEKQSFKALFGGW